MKHTLRRSFAQTPRTAKLSAERILANDVILPWESHPHGMRLWVIGNEFGALGAVWANHESDALDELVDADLGAALLVSEEDQASADEDERESWSHLGNAGEPADLEHCWIAAAEIQPARDFKLLCAFAEARGATAGTLEDFLK